MSDNCIVDMREAIGKAVDKMDVAKNRVGSANGLLLIAKDLEGWANKCIEMAYDGRSRFHTENPRKQPAIKKPEKEVKE